MSFNREKPPASRQSPAGWAELPGSLMRQVSATTARVCGVTDDNEVMCTIRGASSWVVKRGMMKHISIDGDRICGVGWAGGVYCAPSADFPQWAPMPSPAGTTMRQVDVSGDSVCAVDTRDKVWCAEIARGASSGAWDQLPGTAVRQVAIDGERACGVDSSDRVWCTGKRGKQPWALVPGAAEIKQVDISGDSLCGVDSKNRVYCSRYMQDVWIQQPQVVSSVTLSAGGTRMCGVNPTTQVVNCGPVSIPEDGAKSSATPPGGDEARKWTPSLWESAGFGRRIVMLPLT